MSGMRGAVAALLCLTALAACSDDTSTSTDPVEVEVGEAFTWNNYAVDEGWEPLCRFLGCATPAVKFPTGNNVESFRKKMGAAIRHGVWKGFKRLCLVILAFYVLWAAAAKATTRECSVLV